MVGYGGYMSTFNECVLCARFTSMFYGLSVPSLKDVRKI